MLAQIGTMIVRIALDNTHINNTFFVLNLYIKAYNINRFLLLTLLRFILNLTIQSYFYLKEIFFKLLIGYRINENKFLH